MLKRLCVIAWLVWQACGLGAAVRILAELPPLYLACAVIVTAGPFWIIWRLVRRYWRVEA
jgi:hypothetical protein